MGGGGEGLCACVGCVLVYVRVCWFVCVMGVYDCVCECWCVCVCMSGALCGEMRLRVSRPRFTKSTLNSDFSPSIILGLQAQCGELKWFCVRWGGS